MIALSRQTSKAVREQSPSLDTAPFDRQYQWATALERESAAWQAARNASCARIEWLFDVARAREKMGHAYTKPTTIEQAAEAMPMAAE